MDETPAYELPYVLCLGASAGGLEALEEFLRAMPERPGIAIVVLTHLSPDFESLLPELLGRATALPVASARHEEHLQPDRVYVIAPGKNMVVSEGRLLLQTQDRSPGQALNLPIDLFLESLAAEYAQRSIAVILSGTGSDGSRGIRTVKDRGGVVFAQSADSAKFDGMPRSAVQTGVVDAQGTPTELAHRVEKLLPVELPAFDLEPDDETCGDSEDSIHAILLLVREAMDLDLSYLRRSMVSRRIRRRMLIFGIDSLRTYTQRLAGDPAEAIALGEDLLIGVTRFFRDPWAFEGLDNALSRLLASEPQSTEPIRIWVTGCSTGQEVYSLAMMLLDKLDGARPSRPLKIFATDVHTDALEFASRGRYTLSDIRDIPLAQLTRYFQHDGEHYVVRDQLRSQIIFARHNLVTDPPFSRLDLISCRNVLIYLHSEYQKQVLQKLTSVLKPEEGLLFLGAAEVPSGAEESLFCVDSRARVYRRHGPAPVIQGRVLHEPSTVVDQGRAGGAREAVEQSRALIKAVLDASQRTAAVIDRNGKLVELLSDPLRLFRMPVGQPTTELSRMLPMPIVTCVTSGTYALGPERQSAQYVTQVDDPEGSHPTQTITVRVQTLPASSRFSSVLLLLSQATPAQSEDAVRLDPDAADRVSALENDLRQSRESLQAAVEELQSSAEEQQSTNEELLAANEELQSTNEELQSVNQELYTVNSEYLRKNEELQIISADLTNLLDALEVATLYLDSSFNVRKYTAPLLSLVPLQSTDIGRPIGEISHRLDTDLLEEVDAVWASGMPRQAETRADDGRTLRMRIAPYASMLGTTEGVLLTFVDVTELRNAEETARAVSRQLEQTATRLASQAGELEDMFSIIAHDLRRPVLTLDGRLKIALQQLTTGKQDAAKSGLDAALSTVDHMRRMLQDFGDMSRVSRDSPVFENVALEPWLDEVLQPLAERAKAEGVALTRVADRRRATIPVAAATAIVTNLVENALMHGSTGDAPRVEVVCQVHAQRLHISVADNGQGIDREHHGAVFELFRRLDPERIEGTGVGLVAVRRLAQRCGGSVSLASQAGEGAKFSVVLPVRAHTPQDPVLIIEDDDLDAKAIVKQLPDLEVVRARTIAEAQNLLEKRTFSLLIVDLALPDGHGLRALRDIDAKNASTPVLVLTGRTEGVVDEALHTLVTDVIDKRALLGDEFKNMVARVLGGEAVK